MAFTAWLATMAVCRVCGYRWAAVIPLDGNITNMECPACGSMSGEPEGEESEEDFDWSGSRPVG